MLASLHGVLLATVCHKFLTCRETVLASLHGVLLATVCHKFLTCRETVINAVNSLPCLN